MKFVFVWFLLKNWGRVFKARDVHRIFFVPIQLLKLLNSIPETVADEVESKN